MAKKSDPIDELVELSHRIGSDADLVQPGGGNTSVKVDGVLVIKGSGSDLRTLTRRQCTELDLSLLAKLRDQASMSDEEMMRFMRRCMLRPDEQPLPSVETPLHSILPFRFIAHTHDVASMAVTDRADAAEQVRKIWGGDVLMLEYVRPGFPLARRLMDRTVPPGVRGLALEKHGLIAWGDSAEDCWRNLKALVGRAPAPAKLKAPVRSASVVELLPVLRGALSQPRRVVLHFDPELSGEASDEKTLARASRGMATPEHVLRAGVKPLIVRPGPDVSVIRQVEKFREEYRRYHRKFGGDAIPDFVKTVLLPGAGVVTAFKDKPGALAANACYRAVLKVMRAAGDRFQFLDQARAHEVEYWSLERRKVEESYRNEKPLDRRIAVVIGAGSGIGKSAAEKLLDAGAHVVLADLKAPAASGPRSIAIEADVRSESSLRRLFDAAVLQFGGLDILFYSPGVPPSLKTVDRMDSAEVDRQLDVHYRGAVAATRLASEIMIRQRLGGRLIYNASKAAFVPGEGASAYGASKAALAHFARNAANELGRYQITANYINADAIDTPLFRTLADQRARSTGKKIDEILQRYAARSVFGEAMIDPAYVAEAVLWFASDASRYTTGCVLTVGGGFESFPR